MENHFCPICNSTHIFVTYRGSLRRLPKSMSEISPNVLKCFECGHGFLSHNVMSSSYYQSYYYEESKPTQNKDEKEKEAEDWLIKVRDFIGDLKDARVLDFGAGLGYFLETAQKKEPRLAVFANEVSDTAQKILKKKNIRIHQFDGSHSEEKFDIIVSFDVFEHLDEPIKQLKELGQILKKGGSMFIGVPNFGDIYNDIFETYETWFYHHEHLHYFHECSIKKMAQRCGLFENIQVLGHHKYDLSNFYKHAGFCIDGRKSNLSSGEQAWTKLLEQSMRSSHLLMACTRL